MTRYRPGQGNGGARRQRLDPGAPRPLPLVGRTHPALAAVAVEVEEPNDALRRLAGRMAATLMTARRSIPAVAVAAPQVGYSVRLVATLDAPWANPTIVETGGKRVASVEGCLSLPGRWYQVDRWSRLVVEAMHLLTGVSERFEVEDHTAFMWAHEIDHLDGILAPSRGPEVANPSEATATVG